MQRFASCLREDDRLKELIGRSLESLPASANPSLLHWAATTLYQMDPGKSFDTRSSRQVTNHCLFAAFADFNPSLFRCFIPQLNTSQGLRADRLDTYKMLQQPLGDPSAMTDSAQQRKRKRSPVEDHDEGTTEL